MSPHRIVLQQHHATAIDQLRDTDIGIEIFRAGDIDDDFTAETMEKFDLIFLSLNAWKRISTDKLNAVLELQRKKGMSHVIFDE